MASIYGSAYRRDGSKVNGTMRVSTSWNANEAFPRDGQYRLDLGTNPRQRITVYVDGMRYTEIYVDGEQRVDLRV
jgi:hypothetical protein